MPVSKKEFGTTDKGEKVYSYTLDNEKGLSVEILNLGGIIKNLYVTDKDGEKIDVVLGRDSVKEYQTKSGYLGALIGRVANRINNGKFVLNGKEYNVPKNSLGNCLHGGIEGFNAKIWDVVDTIDENGDIAIVLSLTSADGDEGFPGTLDVTVTYTLTSYNSLKINYKAVSDKDTICNMTNHSYFNLGGHASGTIYKQKLTMNADFFTPNTEKCKPNGEVLSVEGTPLDFRTSKPIGRDIDADFEQLKMFSGYDHNMVIRGRGFRLAATAYCDDTGIAMETYTDQPGIQLYTANSLEEDTFKDGVTCGKHSAFCLETQNFPDAVNFAQFPSPILKAGEKYEHNTEYKFIV